MKFKFKTDEYEDRTLEALDCDGDRLRVMAYADESCTLAVNHEAVVLTRKQLGKFAIAILKELSK